MTEIPVYKQLNYWIQHYGSSGQTDQMAVRDFAECETQEVLRSLQSELTLLSRGVFRPNVMDQMIGPNRKMRYGSYEEWAKLMLLWLSAHKTS